jgi:hypothetical protein
LRRPQGWVKCFPFRLLATKITMDMSDVAFQ